MPATMTATAPRRSRIEPGESEADRTRGLGDWLATIVRAAERSPLSDQAEERLARVYGSEQRNLSISDGTKGAYALPSDLYQQVGTLAAARSVARMAGARVIQMDAIEQPVPALQPADDGTLAGFVPEWVADGGPFPAGTLTFGRTMLRAHLLGGTLEVPGVIFRFGPSLEETIAGIMADGLAEIEDRAFLTGTGNGQPLGMAVTPRLVTSAARAGASAITHPDALKVWHRMMPGNRRRAAWLVSRSAEQTAAALAGVAPTVVLPGMPSEMESTLGDFYLQGRPGFVSEHLPALNSPGDFGLYDASRYLIGEWGTLEVAASIHEKFRERKVILRVAAYRAGLPLGIGSFTPGDGGATAGPGVILGAA